MGSTFKKITGELTGANDANRSVKRAMDAQRNATSSSLGTLGTQYDKAQQYQSPFAQTGYDALSMLNSAILGRPAQGYTVDPLTGIPTAGGMVNFAGSPMSFTGQQQLSALNKSFANRGMLGSGQAAVGQSNVYASDAENQIARLMSLLGVGQPAVNNLTNAATNYGSQVSNLNTGQASALSNLYGQQGQIATNFSPWNMGMQIGELGAKFMPKMGA